MEKHEDIDSLIRIAQKNKQYLNGEFDTNGTMTVEMVWDIIKILRREVPYVNGGFGIGFPFHSLKASGELIPNPDFSEYSDRFLRRLEQIKALGEEAWKCCGCQTINPKHIQPEVCKICEETTVKPRELMKILPDLDIFLIIDEPRQETLSMIQNVARQYSFHQSDNDSLETLARIELVFENMLRNRGDVYLPVDLHVVAKDDFLEAMDSIGRGKVDKPMLDIRSMYYDWTTNSKIDFVFDFLFSGTFNPGLCDPDIMSAVFDARRRLVTIFTNEELRDIVVSKEPRAGVMLSYGPTQDIFEERINSWKAA